jgi:hypothetical protein
MDWDTSACHWNSIVCIVHGTVFIQSNKWTWEEYIPESLYVYGGTIIHLIEFEQQAARIKLQKKKKKKKRGLNFWPLMHEWKDQMNGCIYDGNDYDKRWY